MSFARSQEQLDDIPPMNNPNPGGGIDSCVTERAAAGRPALLLQP